MKGSTLKIISVICLILGVGFIALGISTFINIKAFNDNAPSCKAIITDIGSEYSNHRDNGNRYIYVKYNVDGVKYNGMLSNYSSKLRVGEEIKITYSSDNPQIISAKGFEYFGFVISGIGLILFGGGITIIIVRQKRKKLKMHKMKQY